ncbi:MAG: tetratricopeptide repeat protein [Pseudobacter sp.]|uniref:tetratricopeptide repeat protein n=1 Tax=Pseudobacter sp. TaxID=2045420 RepID=UPI003F7E77DF
MIRRLSIFVMLVLTSGAVSRSFGQSGSKAETALNQLMEGNVKLAKATASDVLNADKNSALAYAVRGNTSIMQGDWKNGQIDAEKAVKLSPDNGLFLAMLADIYYSNEQNDLAKKTTDKAIVALRSPQTAFDYYARAMINTRMNRSGEAISDYTKAIALKPNFVRAYAKRAAIYYDTKQTQLAIFDYTQCTNLAPNYTPGFYFRGTIYHDQGRYDNAIDDYTKAIQIDPTYSDAYLNRGICYGVLRRYNDAIYDYNEVEKQNPGNWQIYNRKGHIYYQQEYWKTAVEEYTKAIQKNPKAAISYVYRANAYSKLSDAEKCLMDFLTAQNLEPKNSEVYLNRGNVFYAAGMYDDALNDYKKVVELTPKWSGAYFNVALALQEKQQFSEAINYYQKAIDLDPKNLDAYLSKAYAYDAIGNKKAADAERKKYVEQGGEQQAVGKNAFRSMFPEAQFDAKLAGSMLERGTCTIRGRACTKVDGLIFSASGTKVALYPVTPYLEAWYELREKKEGKKTGVYMSKEANKYRMEVTCDAQGFFQFQGLKPGRYFIQVIHSFNQAKTARVYTGSDVSQNGPVRTTTNYYYDQDYTVARSKRLEKFVDLKDAGDSKRITMANGLIKSCTL